MERNCFPGVCDGTRLPVFCDVCLSVRMRESIDWGLCASTWCMYCVLAAAGCTRLRFFIPGVNNPTRAPYVCGSVL